MRAGLIPSRQLSAWGFVRLTLSPEFTVKSGWNFVAIVEKSHPPRQENPHSPILPVQPLGRAAAPIELHGAASDAEALSSPVSVTRRVNRTCSGMSSRESQTSGQMARRDSRRAQERSAGIAGV